MATGVHFTHEQHPHLEARKLKPAPKLADEHVGTNGRIAAWMTKKVSTMWSFYLIALFLGTWMALATWGPFHSIDPYPFAFLLFLGNLIQLPLIFAILVGQQVLGLAADRRSMRTYEDAEAILHEIEQLHRHLEKQDEVMNKGVSLADPNPHPWVIRRRQVTAVRVDDHHIGFNGRVGAFLTQRIGTMWGFYLAFVVQFTWMALATWGPLHSMDPYPFSFLLFMVNIVQLLLMFIIMVGQDVLGQAGDTRAEQTYLDAEAVLHECTRLQKHLAGQDKVISKLTHYIHEHAPADHPVHEAVTRAG
jgi:uncharacterized membrane protein